MTWNPRYLAYARAEGEPDPDAMLARDRERYPGGSMCGFMLWIQARWREWAATLTLPRAATRWGTDEPDHRRALLCGYTHDDFDRWLNETYL